MTDSKSDLMSGTSAEAIAAAATKDKPAVVADPALVALAERLLADVKAGRVTSMAAIIAAPMGAVQWPAHGSQALELYFGASAFQRQIEGLLTGQNKSRIIRPSG